MFHNQPTLIRLVQARKNFVQTDNKIKTIAATREASWTKEQWTAVDNYLAERLLPPDRVLDQVLKNSAAAGLPAINVSPLQGKLLMLLAQIRAARNILEIGTLGGYS